MKKIWKVLGIAAIAASVPVVFRNNRETGEKTVEALLWQVKTTPNQETGKRDVVVNIFPNRFPRKKEESCPQDEPTSNCKQECETSIDF